MTFMHNTTVLKFKIFNPETYETVQASGHPRLHALYTYYPDASSLSKPLIHPYFSWPYNTLFFLSFLFVALHVKKEISQ